MDFYVFVDKSEIKKCLNIFSLRNSLLLSLYGEQSRFDANLIKTYKVLRSK